MSENGLFKNKQEILPGNEAKEIRNDQNEQPVEQVAEETCAEINSKTKQFEKKALKEVEQANSSIGLDVQDVEVIKSEIGIDKQIAEVNAEAEFSNTSSQAEIRQVVSEDISPTEDTFELLEQCEQISKLRARLDYLKSKLEVGDADFETGSRDYEILSGERAEQATVMADRVSEAVKVSRDEEIIKQEIVNIESFLNSDSVFEQIGQQLNQHYLKNPNQSPEQQEKLKQTVEQTATRNNVFFIHTINESEQLRHNENSNISGRATFEDDIDILLSLEPSVSASTVAPGVDEDGMVSGLWSHSGGVIIGKGQIKEAHEFDANTVSHGIKNRSSRVDYKVSIEEIDKNAVNRRVALEDDFGGNKTTGIGGYNEFVVDDPKIFGYYLHAQQDSDGNFWTDLLVKRQGQSKNYEEQAMFKRNINRYSSKVTAIESKGIPVYIMAPDRRIYEYKEIKDGQIIVGDELKPEDVANGKSGKSIEERKVIGKNLLRREIFKDDRTKHEANEILFTQEEVEKQKKDKEIVDEILKARFEHSGFVQLVLQRRNETMQEVFKKFGIKNAEAQKLLANPQLLDELSSLWGTEDEKDGYDEVLHKYLN